MEKQSIIYRFAKASIILAGAIVLCWVGEQKAIAEIFRTAQPQIALKYGKDPISQLILLERKFHQKDPKTAPKYSEALALASIRSVALNPIAIRQLALSKRAANDDAGYSKLMSIAESVALRDPQIQMTMLQDALAQRDVATSMRHVDVIIKTAENARPEMYSALTPLLSDKFSREKIAEFYREGAFWTPEFFTFASSAAKHPDDVAKLGLLFPNAMASPEYEVARTTLLRRLGEEGSPALLRQFYEITPNADTSLLHSPALTQKSIAQVSPPITWQLFEASGAQASFVSGPGGDLILEVKALSGSREKIARKALFLLPGRYNLTFFTDLSDIAKESSLTINVSCRSNTGDSTISVVNSLVTDEKTKLNFTVPPSCSSQILDFSVTGGSGQEESRISISQIELKDNNIN